MVQRRHRELASESDKVIWGNFWHTCFHVARALMDEVHFEEGGAVVQMRKSASETPKLLAKDPQENERN
jgi:hypothetical protein